MLMRNTIWGAAVFFAVTHAGAVYAQLPGSGAHLALRRTPLQTLNVPGSNYQVVIGISELAPNGVVGGESHPGPETGYVLRGSATLLIRGQQPLPLKPGQSWKTGTDVVHEFRAGPEGLKALVTWLVHKAKPFATPAK